MARKQDEERGAGNGLRQSARIGSRSERLAAALRENLRKRKEQARARNDDTISGDEGRSKKEP